MKIIKSFYPHYYSKDDAIKEAVALWSNVLEDADFLLMQKSLKQFVKTDTKGYPPVIGQLISLGQDIKKAEWEARQREIDALPQPKIERMEMPEYLRIKINEWLNKTI